MSFCTEVKNEIMKNTPVPGHCRKAEAAGYLLLCSKKSVDKTEGSALKSVTDSFGGLSETIKACGISEKGQGYVLTNPALLSRTCCKRAFVRGAFLAIGTISDPQVSYQLEFVSSSLEGLQSINDALMEFDVTGSFTVRGKKHVLYIKDSEKISDVLNIMEAHVALMNYENAKILKELRNNINRRVNCEASNFRKVAEASASICESIRYLDEHGGLETLPDGLVEIAVLRMENPEDSLSELGKKANPVLGKSGVNHRLEKIRMIAEEMKKKEESHEKN